MYGKGYFSIALFLSVSILLAACSGGTSYMGTTTPTGTTTYTVTFVTDGGSAVDSQTVESGKTATEPAAPTKSGYTFGGWYDDSALTSVFSFSTKITKDTTLYAKWIDASVPTYTVTFETNGGSTVTSQTVASGGKATKPTAPTKSGFAFLDWYADSTFTAKYDFSAFVTADTTVYARWWDSTGFVLAEGSTVGEVTGSNVFISGRTVEIASLLVCDHEVTQGEYETYCTYSGSNSPSDTKGKGTNYPAYYVSWYDALVYCNKRSLAEGLTPCYTIGGKTDPAEWGAVPTSSDATWNAAVQDMTANGYRLPTEAEWEYLARGGKDGATGTQTTYAGSDTVDNVAWYSENSSKTHEVKGKDPISSSFKLYDMSGNVWEWCWDWHGTVAADTPAAGASSGSNRVLRGGSWNNNASNCAVSNRNNNNPYNRNNNNGFRVVRFSSKGKRRQEPGFVIRRILSEPTFPCTSF